jgi:hypothetical protein
MVAVLAVALAVHNKTKSTEILVAVVAEGITLRVD